MTQEVTMKESVKAKTRRSATRDLFAELSEGLEALAEGRGGGERVCVLKVTTVGHSLGVILPREILERLRVAKGDILDAVETKNGIELTANDPTFAAQVEAAERVMREDRDALKKLTE